jgi:hypothetical protein
MALAWKAGWVHALAGSNPASSATPTRGNASHYDLDLFPRWDLVSVLVSVGSNSGCSATQMRPAYPGSNVSPNGIGDVLIAGSH